MEETIPPQCQLPVSSPAFSILSYLKSIFWYILPIAFPYLLYRHLGGSQNYATWCRQLKGQVVLITGASSGLGEALAYAFYKAGCKVILASRRIDELENIKKALTNLNVAGTTYTPCVLRLDLTELNSVREQAAKALSFHGHVDILVNNSGISHRGGALHTSIDVDLKIMTVNYFGQVALTKEIVSNMVGRRRGHIVAISSIQGLIGIPYRSAYAASKHALQAFCDCLRAEVCQHNIKVTVVSPGYIRTKLSENALRPDGMPHGVTDKATAEGYSPDEVAEKVLCAVLNNANEIVISTASPRIAIFLRQFMPPLYFWIMGRRAKNMGKEMSDSSV